MSILDHLDIIRRYNITPDRAIGGLKGSALASLIASCDLPLIVSVNDESSAKLLKNDIIFYQRFFGNGRTEVLPFPAGPYGSGQLARIISEAPDIPTLVSYPDALLHPGIDPLHKDEIYIHLAKGAVIDRDELEQKLVKMGYRPAPIAGQGGDISVRRWVIDLFPGTENSPVRIEFFGDVIDSLRRFRIDTQRTTEHLEMIRIYPAARVWPDAVHSRIIDNICTGRVVIDLESSLSSAGYEGPVIDASLISNVQEGPMFMPLSGSGVLRSERESTEEIPEVIKDISDNIVIVVENDYQARRMSDLFKDKGVFVPVLKCEELKDTSERIVMTIGSLSEGLRVEGLMILTQKELFGKDIVLEKMVDAGGEGYLDNIEDIREGDMVVHSDHGIGRFRKLVSYEVGDSDVDAAMIEYADGAVLYVPLYNIGKLRRYRAGEEELPVLDAMGGRTWKKKKRRAKKSIDIMVKKLLSLYALREVKRGFHFSPDTEMHREFNSFFPYVETEDQLRAADEIAKDMESENVMDRVLCGDVGFGKTEVAMRAAFKAVFDGKQVAVIVPTTVLCDQHYRSFVERFEAFPVNIGYISRFRTPSEIKRTIGMIEKGDLDIVIGTHSLMKRDIRFSDLGLMIIDEEHRFGVAQKEKLKELKKGVDCLMLSATPIPRTLQMTLSGIRAMSIIDTPPEERLAVRSSLVRYDKGLIVEAVSREVERGGQVFFVHNRVKDINKVLGTLKDILPDVRIAVAHGQMRPSELEKVMFGFMKHEADILLCTNIIGSGIDISTANTIFVNMAEGFGLADLYQLKGRVGRGNTRAYAFFIAGTDGSSTKKGKQRLKAIEELNYLGAGLKLAMKDLEIRGAGTLLGYRQSGYIREIGFDMYQDILQKEILRLKGKKIDEDPEPQVDVNTVARIPEDYVSDDMIRMSLYRRLSRIKVEEEIVGIRDDILDRFGEIPEEVNNLLALVSLKPALKRSAVSRLIIDSSGVKIIFISKDRIDMDSFLGLAETYDGVRFMKDGIKIYRKEVSWEDNVQLTRDVLERIAKQGDN